MRGIGSAAPTPPREAWQRFLQSVQERSASPVLPYVSRYSQGELLYVIDRQSARGELVPTVQVHWRTRKKNGEWGRPQPAALAVADVPHLADPDDREIVSLLLGATEPQAVGMQYVSVATRASFRITGPLIERVLPLIGRSGRLFMREGSPRSLDLIPLVWDDGPPWIFRLDVSVLPDERLAIDGALIREDLRIAVTEPDFLLSPDFL